MPGMGKSQQLVNGCGIVLSEIPMSARNLINWLSQKLRNDLEPTMLHIKERQKYLRLLNLDTVAISKKGISSDRPHLMTVYNDR
jgi:hypothetical protein